jgi:hypothetical protein
VRPLLEETLGRGVNLPWSSVPARGWARVRRDRVPRVGGALTGIAPIRPLQLCADGGYQLRLGALGVPLITVPNNTARYIGREHASGERSPAGAAPNREAPAPGINPRRARGCECLPSPGPTEATQHHHQLHIICRLLPRY